MLKVLLARPIEVNDRGYSFGFTAPAFLTEENIDRRMDCRFITSDNVVTLSELVREIRVMMHHNNDQLLAVGVTETDDLLERVYSFLQLSVGFEPNVDLAFDKPKDKKGAIFFMFVRPDEAHLLRNAIGWNN